MSALPIEIVRETRISRLYKKGDAYYLSQKTKGVLRRLKISPEVFEYFKGRIEIDKAFDATLTAVKARGDADYYQTKIEG